MTPQGLIRAPAFNGCVGVVHSVDAKTGRYDVLLTSQSGCKEQWAKVGFMYCLALVIDFLSLGGLGAPDIQKPTDVHW